MKLYETSNIQYPCRRQEEDEHDHRHDVLDHDTVQPLKPELAPAVLDFFDDPVGTYDPANQDRGQHRDERHHKAVADVVHEVQKLADAAVGQRKLDVELAISQSDDD